ncbi:hypothetical protein [Streptomyces sp. JJ38]|uniref:hypothetical protein n=1 Tax=Streptomyces sp. JJ38 TaxID=2738128 RepID=UPI001C5972B0|nr:hypothetical protein [Streptomyces sp. JJ38]MBW1597081.1 hypothetical protein [Streptomyces sp. JJ38]
MGIDSEKLVFDYLSRVGDLAHRTTMTAAERARLIGELRAGIERARATGGAESVAEVRRLLSRLGRPEDVVEAAGSGAEVPAPRPAEPGRDGEGPRPGRGERLRPRRRRPPEPEPGPPPGPTPPHLVGMDELPPEAADPEWWRGEGGPVTQPTGGQVAGFVGGIEIPEMLMPPPEVEEDDGKPAGAGNAVDGGPAVDLTKGPEVPTGVGAALQEDAPAPDAEAPPPGRWARMRRLAGPRNREPGLARVGGPVELLAALALVAGTVFGSLLALAAGWLLAWWSPRLPLTERKWAVLGVPGAVVGAGTAWLWGRLAGHWGEPIPEGTLGEAVKDTYPWCVRAAALASALFLVWRARRVR